MILEYEKPIVDIVTFLSVTHLAREDDGDRSRAATGNDDVQLPDFSTGEDVGDW